jgi:hypothetical protein
MKLKIFILGILIGGYIIIASLFSSTICVFKNVTGLPCPGCGLTRAYLSLLHLDLIKALQFHPLFLLPAVILIILIYNKIKINKFVINEKLVLGFIIIFLIVYLFRMITLFPNHVPMDINYKGIIPRIIRTISGIHL